MWLILTILAAVCNALMDMVENENFHQSIFASKDPKFWYKRESWKHARKFIGWKADAWHISKSAMIILLCLAIVLYKPLISGTIFLNAPYLAFSPDWLLAGASWNITFNLFYNRIFRKNGS